MMTAARLNDHFTIMSIVRANSPRLEPGRLAVQVVSEALRDLRQAVDALVALMADGSRACVSDVLRCVRDTELLRLDDRFAPHFLAVPTDDGQGGFSNVQAFLACGVAELWSYRRYIDEESPFATHHGVKGAQFERVMVVIDDEEAAYNLYSYGKYFGYLPLSRPGSRAHRCGRGVGPRSHRPSLLRVLLTCRERSCRGRVRTGRQSRTGCDRGQEPVSRSCDPRRRRSIIHRGT